MLSVPFSLWQLEGFHIWEQRYSTSSERLLSQDCCWKVRHHTKAIREKHKCMNVLFNCKLGSVLFEHLLNIHSYSILKIHKNLSQSSVLPKWIAYYFVPCKILKDFSLINHIFIISLWSLGHSLWIMQFHKCHSIFWREWPCQEKGTALTHWSMFPI